MADRENSHRPRCRIKINPWRMIQYAPGLVDLQTAIRRCKAAGAEVAEARRDWPAFVALANDSFGQPVVFLN